MGADQALEKAGQAILNGDKLESFRPLYREQDDDEGGLDPSLGATD